MPVPEPYPVKAARAAFAVAAAYLLAAAWLLVACVLAVPSAACAGSRDEVAGATMQWAQAIAADDPDQVVALYADDAVLWGTLSPVVRADRAAVRDYFVAAFKALPGLKVEFGNQLIRLYGDTAVNTGSYTFSYLKDGQPRSLPARYSFTYVRRGERWLIVDHHSSAMPALAN